MTSIDPIDSRSRLDPGDRPFAVVGYPDRLAVNHDGAGMAADRDLLAALLAALDLDAGDRVVLRVGDPDEARACVDAAGPAADRDRLAEKRPGHGVDPADAVGAAVRDPDHAGGDGHPGGAAADQRRRPGGGGAEIDAPHRAGRRAAHPYPAGADGEAERRRMGCDVAFEDTAALGVDRRDAAAALVRHPDPLAAEDQRAGAPADVDAVLDGAGVAVDA